MSINQIIKTAILQLATDNNIFLDDVTLKKLSKSARTKNSILEEIKQNVIKQINPLEEHIINFLEQDKQPQIIEPQITILPDNQNNDQQTRNNISYSNLLQLEEFKNNCINEELAAKNLEIIAIKRDLTNEKTITFNSRIRIKELEYKVNVYKNIINRKNSLDSSSSSDSDDSSDRATKFTEYYQYDKKEYKIPYHEIPLTSSIKLINKIMKNSDKSYNELAKLSKHEIKVIYNNIFNNKLSRKFQK